MGKVLSALPINWTLMKSPENWLIIWLMIVVAGAAIALILPAPSFDEIEE